MEWRRRPDLNRGWRFCRPLPYHLATAPSDQKRGLIGGRRMERETGFEPATSTLARSHSTTELFPPVPSHSEFNLPYQRSASKKDTATCRILLPGSLRGERIPNQRHLRRASILVLLNRHNIKAAWAHRPSNPLQVALRHHRDLPLLWPVDCRTCPAEPRGRARLHFNEHQYIAISGDNVDLAVSGSETARQDGVSAAAQLLAGKVFPPAAETVLLGTRHDAES